MEVILIKDIENLGYANDIVNVKPGYANNYLIPQGYAKIMQELQPQLLKLQQEQNLENMCKFYDDALEKLK